MKNWFVLAFAILLMASFSFAQNVNVGGRAAFNFGTTWGDDTEDEPWGAGFTAGLGLKAKLTERVAIVPELAIDLRREHDKEDGVEATWTTWALDIPVLFRLNATPEFFFEAGPTFAFFLSSEIEVEDEIASLSVDLGNKDIDMLNTFEFGLAAGFGYSVLPNLDLGFRFNLALTSMIDATEYGLGDDVKNLRLQWAISYWFI